MYYVYVLRCTDASLYTGITTDPARRFAQHCGKRAGGAKYTASHRPLRMEAVWRTTGRREAARLEYQLKQLTKAQKEGLCASSAALPFTEPTHKIQILPNGRIIPMLFMCYPKCSTCKKARTYLEEHEIAFDSRDITKENPSEVELRLWHKKSGLPLKRFFNTSGQLYRSMELSKKLPAMTEEEQIALLASDGMLVKRPLLIAEHFVLVGFKQNEWDEKL